MNHPSKGAKRKLVEAKSVTPQQTLEWSRLELLQKYPQLEVRRNVVLLDHFKRPLPEGGDQFFSIKALFRK